MRPRVCELYRVLKKTGSFYYHCDWHADSYVRVLLDQVFGANQFRSHILWKRQTAHNDARQRWGAVNDSILFYTKSDTYHFQMPYRAHDPAYVAKFYSHEEPDGRRYQLGDIGSPNPRPNLMYTWRGFEPPPKGWRFELTTMERLYAEGRIHVKEGNRPRVKRYLEEMAGEPIGNWWDDITPVQAASTHRMNYPTQKPLPLLERILQASSKPGDVVLDAFCGCGTTLHAAQKLERRWIGIDVSPTACRVMAERLVKHCGEREGETFWVRDLPKTETQLRAFPPFEFENWAVNALNTVLVGATAVANKVQVGDKGIDGRIYPIQQEKVKRDGHDLFGEADRWFPIQVKQKDKASRPDIDHFETAMRRQKRHRGVFVSFGYTADAEFEIKRARREDNLDIIPVTVYEILNDQQMMLRI